MLEICCCFYHEWSAVTAIIDLYHCYCKIIIELYQQWLFYFIILLSIVMISFNYNFNLLYITVIVVIVVMYVHLYYTNYYICFYQGTIILKVSRLNNIIICTIRKWLYNIICMILLYRIIALWYVEKEGNIIGCSYYCTVVHRDILDVSSKSSFLFFIFL
jgi:hypothetical protein